MKLLFQIFLLCAGAVAAVASAQVPPQAAGVSRPGEPNLAQWMRRLQESSQHRAYVGTFVVSSATGGIASSRIWHAFGGEQQVERVEALAGAPRTTFRWNDEVVTFLHDSKQVIQERRQVQRLFPNVVPSGAAVIPDFYTMRVVGRGRVAGVDADVLQLQARDSLRFGYRIWSERKTGLLVQLQTVDADGATLEQSAFSDLQLDAPVSVDQLLELMHNTQGYRVERVQTVPIAVQAWVLKSPVPGFRLTGCASRSSGVQAQSATFSSPGTVQCIYSDGLASVSLFVQPLDGSSLSQPVSIVMGATSLLSRRVKEGWLTVVGEVPVQTLQLFSNSFERAR